MVLNWIATAIIGFGALHNLYESIDREELAQAFWAIVFGVVVLVAVWR